MKRYDTDGGIPTLALALDQYMNIDEIKPLVAFAGYRVPTRKADLIALIVKHLEGDGLRRVWEQLDETQRAAVSEVVHSEDSGFDPGRFRAKYGRSPVWGSLDRYKRDTPPTGLCFLFYGGGVMPDDLKARLEAFVPPPVAAAITTLDPLPAAYELISSYWDVETKSRKNVIEPIPLTVRDSEQAAARELLAVLRLVDAGKFAVSDKTRRASGATLAAVAAVLEGGDYYPHVPPKDQWSDENAGPIRAFAWPLLIQAGGLAQLAGARLQLTKAGRKALAEPPASTLRTLWQKWVNTTLLDELSRIDCVKGQTGKGKHGLTAVATRRKALGGALAECPSGRWIATQELCRFMQAAGHDFEVTRNPWALYVGELQYGSLGGAGSKGMLLERYILCVLLEYAATLGLLDVALIPPAGARYDYGDLWGTDELPYFSRYDGLMYFRINALGAYCLGSAEAYAAAPTEREPGLRVLPNLEIVTVGAGLDAADGLALDAYAERVSARVWQLQPGKLLAASAEGRSVEEVRDFLAARSLDPLPETVLRLFADIANRGARLQDRGLARLVECADPVLAALIANDARTRKLCLPAGDRHLVVPAASETAFRRALMEVGYLLPPNAEPVRKKGGKTAANDATKD
jgi:hypothetical protein